MPPNKEPREYQTLKKGDGWFGRIVTPVRAGLAGLLRWLVAATNRVTKSMALVAQVV
ncbi:hypothetical protein [Bosea caraganae]|uniref:hypothetical protein n=1 Tax=Bosea caraganae TaxID=2763117 RepID=UPI0015F02F13|nr:hypothetical protein [Bosea caraganae]